MNSLIQIASALSEFNEKDIANLSKTQKKEFFKILNTLNAKINTSVTIDSDSDSGCETEYFTPITTATPTPVQTPVVSIYEQTLDFFINQYKIIPVLKNIQFVNPPLIKNYAINGEVQSGKTKTLASFAITSVVQKQKSVIIVRNLKDDCSQVVKQLNIINKQHINYIKCKDSFNYSTYKINDIDKWLLKDSYDILVLMANTTQLKHFVNKVKDVEFSLFIDEADALMNTIKTEKDYNVNQCMKLIYEQSKIVFLVSATNYAILFEHSILTSQNLYININDDYKGVDDIEFINLPNLPKKSKGTLIEKSPNLYYVMTNLTHRKIYANHPTILLAKCTHLVSDQKQFVQTITTNNEWKYEWAAISYNGSGVCVYHHTLKGDINISNVKGTHLGNGIYSFKNVDIQEALAYFRENGGQSKFPRIVIISGHLASRCINFMDTTYNWHITDEYIDASKTMDCTDLTQSLRICGIHKISTPLKVWTSEEVMKNIKRTFDNLNKYIQNFTYNVEANKLQDVCCKTMLSGVKIHKDKLGDRKVCKVKAPYTKVSNVKHDNMDKMLCIEKNIDSENYDEGIDDMVIVDTEKFEKETSKNTQKYIAYIDCINLLVDKYGTGKWVKRATILDDLHINENRSTFEGYFTEIYKSSMKCKDENTSGFLMKKVKEGNKPFIYFRIN